VCLAPYGLRMPRTTTSPRTATGQAVSGRPANPLRLGLAVLCILGGGLVFVGLYRARGHQVPVLVLARDVAAGQVINDGDLGVAEVAATGVATVSVADRSSLAGKVAKVALSKGALLAPGQLVADGRVGPGEALVAVAFPETVVPRSIHNEDSVRLVVADKVVDAKVTDIKPVISSSGTVSITFQLKQEADRVVSTGKDVRLLVVSPELSGSDLEGGIPVTVGADGSKLAKPVVALQGTPSAGPTIEPIK
jgi:SAF domain